MSRLLLFFSLSNSVRTKAIMSPAGEICGSLILLIRMKSSKQMPLGWLIPGMVIRSRRKADQKKMDFFIASPPIEYRNSKPCNQKSQVNIIWIRKASIASSILSDFQRKWTLPIASKKVRVGNIVMSLKVQN